MEVPNTYFHRMICSYVFAEIDELEKLLSATRGLIKFNKNNLKKNGDIVFDIRKEIWRRSVEHKELCLNYDLKNLFINENDDCDFSTSKFIDYASQWKYPVSKVQMYHEKCILRLNRLSVIKTVLSKVNEDPDIYGYVPKNPRKTIKIVDIFEGSDKSILENLSLYRARLVRETLENILLYSEFSINNTEDINKNDNIVFVDSVIQYSQVYTPVNNRSRNIIIQTGLVMDPLTKKCTSLSTNEYKEMKSEQLHLMAIHKYRVKISALRSFSDLKEKLGEAAIKVDLLEVKHSSPVNIVRNSRGSTKGAAFIMYNSARLESLLKRFQEQVSMGHFVEIPHYETLDFNLLKEEEEWEMVFSFILEFPNILSESLNLLEKGTIRTHLLIKYLSSFVSVFSTYYRRIRILTDSRKYLMPYVHVRMYLIKAVRIVLNKVLRILNIEPVSFM